MQELKQDFLCNYLLNLLFQIEEVEPDVMMNASELKAEGNELFKAGQFDKALSSYTKALKISDGKSATSEERSAIHKNKAACYLKLDNPQNASAEASKGKIRVNVRHTDERPIGFICCFACCEHQCYHQLKLSPPKSTGEKMLMMRKATST